MEFDQLYLADNAKKRSRKCTLPQVLHGKAWKRAHEGVPLANANHGYQDAGI